MNKDIYEAVEEEHRKSQLNELEKRYRKVYNLRLELTSCQVPERFIEDLKDLENYFRSNMYGVLTSK